MGCLWDVYHVYMHIYVHMSRCHASAPALRPSCSSGSSCAKGAMMHRSSGSSLQSLAASISSRRRRLRTWRRTPKAAPHGALSPFSLGDSPASWPRGSCKSRLRRRHRHPRAAPGRPNSAAGSAASHHLIHLAYSNQYNSYNNKSLYIYDYIKYIIRNT